MHVIHAFLKLYPLHDGQSRYPVKLFRMVLNLILGKVQENSEICCRQTTVTSERYSIVGSSCANPSCLLASHLCTRKENQVKQKKAEEAKEKAVRRVYVIFQLSRSPSHL